MTDEILSLLREKVFPLVNLEELRGQFFVYDNEGYERIELSKEEFHSLKTIFGGSLDGSD